MLTMSDISLNPHSKTLPIAIIANARLYYYFYHATPSTEIYTLSLHDALPISRAEIHVQAEAKDRGKQCVRVPLPGGAELRKLLFDKVELDRLIDAWKA